MGSGPCLSNGSTRSLGTPATEAEASTGPAAAPADAQQASPSFSLSAFLGFSFTCHILSNYRRHPVSLQQKCPSPSLQEPCGSPAPAPDSPGSFLAEERVSQEAELLLTYRYWEDTLGTRGCDCRNWNHTDLIRGAKERTPSEGTPRKPAEAPGIVTREIPCERSKVGRFPEEKPHSLPKTAEQIASISPDQE